MDIAAIRAGIAAAVAGGVTLPVAAITATGYAPDSVTVPHFFTAEYEIEYDKTHGGGEEIELVCRVLVGRADDRASQALLDAMLKKDGPASLKAAIEAERGAPGQMALGGLCDDLHVRRAQGYRWYEHNGTDYIGAELVIRIIG